MEPIVPLLSSSVTGPLGVVHLPRFWYKVLLHACGRLPEGYWHGSGLFDERTCADIGLDLTAAVAYIETEKPDYLTFEAWVRTNATKLDAASIAAHNESILGHPMREELASQRRARFGIEDPSFNNGVRLNDLDDWDCLHELLVRSKEAPAI